MPALVAPLSGGGARPALVADVEADDAGQRHELGEQVDEVRRPESGRREDHDVESRQTIRPET